MRAVDRTCSGQTASVNYSIKPSDRSDSLFFTVKEDGKVCVLNSLDFEQRQRFQLTVLASGPGRFVMNHTLNVGTVWYSSCILYLSNCVTILTIYLNVKINFEDSI